MKLLAFETATEACSVALWIDGQVLERFELAPRRHAELSLPWAGELLAEAGIAKSQLDGIAVGRGPGAFTGVRLAIALAQGIALALDRPVIPVSTLAALAEPLRRGLSDESGSEDDSGVRYVLAAIDARMGEVYSGAFALCGKSESIRALGDEAVGAPGSVLLPDEAAHWLGVGTGFAAVEGALAARLSSHFTAIDVSALPRAASIVRLAASAFTRGEAVDPDKVEPAYLRNNVALTTTEQQALRDSR